MVGPGPCMAELAPHRAVIGCRGRDSRNLGPASLTSSGYPLKHAMACPIGRAVGPCAMPLNASKPRQLSLA